MNRAKRSRGKSAPKSDNSVDNFIRSLMRSQLSEREVRELLYWSREPGLLEVIRGIASMPEKTRGVIETFIGLTRQHGTVVASLETSGVLRLSSADVARCAAVARCVIEDELPPVLN